MRGSMVQGTDSRRSNIRAVRGGQAPLRSPWDITGNWDYDGFWAQFDVAPVTTVAEKLANREMLDAFVSIREHLGMTIFLTGTPKLTERLEEALRTPHTLVPLLADGI